MITCPKCSKNNQDHYKFCLGCGAELPREKSPQPFSPKTPPHGVPAAGAQPAQTAGAPMNPAATQESVVAPTGGSNPPVASPAVAGGMSPSAAPPVASSPPAASPSAPPATGGAAAQCPQCGHSNVAGNRFCASCGYNLSALAPAPAPTASAPPQPAPGASRVVLTALRADGSEAGTYPLPDSPSVTVGRDTGSIFAGDSYLSPKHASFSSQGGTLSIKDEGSLNGVYIKLRPNQPWKLAFSDVFRIGQEIVRLEPLKPQPAAADGVQRFGSPAAGYIGRLALVIGRDTSGNAFPIPDRGVHLGRERGDILFSEDGYVSGLHCRVAPEADGSIYLTDMGSSNGTFVRLNDVHKLVNGDTLLMGQQLFRVDLQ